MPGHLAFPKAAAAECVCRSTILNVMQDIGSPGPAGMADHGIRTGRVCPRPQQVTSDCGQDPPTLTAE